MLILIWVHTVSKGYQQTTKVAAIKARVTVNLEIFPRNLFHEKCSKTYLQHKNLQLEQDLPISVNDRVILPLNPRRNFQIYSNSSNEK